MDQPSSKYDSFFGDVTERFQWDVDDLMFTPIEDCVFYDLPLPSEFLDHLTDTEVEEDDPFDHVFITCTNDFEKVLSYDPK